ncbi:MAG: hypothetical protein JWM28_300, partial [Chitinophagaceae bacterium]|nr:hypothetical protein [Chitinophagaceae bacterium]
MKKITAPLIVLTGFIISLSLSCKKEKTKEPLCSWFPVMSGTSASFTVTQEQGNTPPYPTYSKPYPTTDSSLSIYSLLFVFRDCASGQLLFDHGPSDERIVLFDKNRVGDSILITDVVFHGIRH